MTTSIRPGAPRSAGPFSSRSLRRYPARVGFAALCLAATLGASSASPRAASQQAARPARPNLLLITVDTLRPDALGWVAGRNPTPNLDALAAEGVRFPAALSPVPITLPSHTSIHTALLPRRHGVRDNGQVVPGGGVGGGAPTLAERLAAGGWSTAAFVSGFPLAAQFGLDRGFRRYDDAFGPPAGGGQPPLERSAARTADVALAWLATAAEPWFLWVHFYDPHDPYDPPAELRRPGPRGAYDGEVAAVDRAVGELRQAVEKTAAPVLTVFTADHGEGLGEHGEATHGFFVYESTLAVPLIFHQPGRLRPAASSQRARLIDVAPTVLDLLGRPALDGVDGVSLRGLLEGRRQTVPAAYLESRRPWTSYGWAPLAAVVDDGWKLIAAPRPELYDLTTDPGERRNRVEEERPRARRLQAVLRARESRPAAAAAADDDPETVARLRSLGYVGGGTSRDEPPAGLPDPKDRVDLWNALGQAEALIDRGELTAAVAGFDAVLAAEPGNRFALARSGIVLLEAGRSEAAVPRLQAAVAADSEQPETRRALASAYNRLGRHAEAVGEWMEAVRLQPRRLDGWVNLGGSFGLSGQASRAAAAYRRAVELAPDDPDLGTRLAFAEHAAGDVAAAVRQLRRVAGLVGEGRFAHSGALGLLLLRLDRREDARRWLARSRPGEAEMPQARFELARLQAAAGDEAAARRTLAEALAADPNLVPAAAADPLLRPLAAER